jgi:Ca-activated chloride channel family protein
MLGQFHFLQPLWLLALIPLGLLAWGVATQGSSDSAWRKVCDTHLLRYLLLEGAKAGERLAIWLLSIGWLVAVLALANPAWERRPQPVFQAKDAQVIVLDLSLSMSAPDLEPSRLARARFKVTDILRRSEDGQIGLVVFAGDAFVVSPLTEDADTIEALLNALDPSLMPVQGSRADLGLRQAGELLRQAGLPRGQIVLLADGADGERAAQAAEELHAQGYVVSVLGVGTQQGAPVPDGRGGFVRDASGRVVVPKLESVRLREVAAAGGGRYADIRSNDADLDALRIDWGPRLESEAERTDLQTEAWEERGPWLVLLLLPVAALAFRRGWLLALVLMLGSVVSPDPAMAFGWEDLWSRPDQQAARALEGGEYERAAEKARDPLRRGTAEYRQGDYERALEAFSSARGADGAYNRGNALAKLGRYEDAMAAYDAALAERPDMEDAAFNKAAIEELLRQQQAQESRPQGGGEGGDARQGQSEPASEQRKSGQERGGKEQSGQEESSQAEPESAQSAGAGQPTGGGQQQSGEQQSASTRESEPGSQDEQEEGRAAAPAPSSSDAGDSETGVRSATRAQAEDRTSSEATERGQDALGQTREEERQSRDLQAPEQAGNGQDGEDSVQPGNDTAIEGLAEASADPLSTEEQQAIEQWLRRIPDDPGGLLRRKFLYQYRQRAARADAGSSPW